MSATPSVEPSAPNAALPPAPPATGKKKIKAALVGNPNCGKTTIFNALTGARQHVGNYPGVTVESKIGHFHLSAPRHGGPHRDKRCDCCHHDNAAASVADASVADAFALPAGDYEIELIDLPGIYSLSSSSPEEEVAFSELTAAGLDLIINVVNCAALQRNLYLTTQVSELHIPMLIAFNMSDEAEAKGERFDLPALEDALGYPIVKTVGHKGGGLDELKEKLLTVCANLSRHKTPKLNYGEDVNDAIAKISVPIAEIHVTKFAHIPPRFFAIKLLEHDATVLKMPEFAPAHPLVAEQIQHLSGAHAIDADTFVADRRYALISGICRQAVTFNEEHRREVSDQIDAVVTNRWLGLPLFLLAIYLVFWVTFTGGAPLMELIEDGFGWLQDFIKAEWTSDSMWQRLLVEGVIGGVGGVLVFLPNIVLMFIALAFLEDSGYMARASFVVDGIMRKFGLHGKSFVPLILGFGCTVPAIMATRSIESARDRMATIMILPLMSCGARLPIHLLIIAAFFSAHQATMMFAIYLLGVVIALTAAMLMKKTIFRGDNEVYLMELPPYRLPTLRGIFIHAGGRAKMYLHRAGTIILAVSILLFFANNYPEKQEFSVDYEAARAAVAADDEDAKTEIDNAEQSEQLAFTVSGRIGKYLEPVFQPLGFDWKISTAMVGALAAKEVLVSQLGILYAAGDADETSESLRESLVKNYSPLQGFCLMVFALLSIPCIATLAMVRRELNSWGYAALEAVGLLALAYVVTFIVYQGGTLLHIGTKLAGG
ncbi:MAG: ferrous iron transport protein B [Planctomycetota bacterium]|jgi:ferrous iron transport protein B|nr:ferrous iron transport protein B [Planctomycetota bacterium]